MAPDHQHDPEADDGPEHLLLVARALGPEVHGDDPQAVQRVEEDGGDEAVLQQADDRGLVGRDDLVVGLGGDTHERGVEDVDEQEEEDEDAGDSMSHPGPHAFPAAVQRSSRHGKPSGSGDWGRPASLSVGPGRVRSTGPGHRSDALSARYRGVGQV